MYNSRNNVNRYNIFMFAPNQPKEAYVQLETGRRYGEHKSTITDILHQYHPRFLELDVRWIDALIET